MRTALLVTLLLTAAVLAPVPATARVGVHVDISLPSISFNEPPDVVVIPGTYVYVVPDLDVDIYFYGGWWWRPWEGQWYRSRNYDSGWTPYRSAPSFYRTVPPGWRHYYSDHYWEGFRWNYERIPVRELQANWRNWAGQRHWERNNNWSVEGYNPRTRRPHDQGYGRGQDRGQGRGHGR